MNETTKLIIFASVSSLNGSVKRDYEVVQGRDSWLPLHEASLVLTYTDSDSVYVWKNVYGDRDTTMSQEWAELLIQTHVQKCSNPPAGPNLSDEHYHLVLPSDYEECGGCGYDHAYEPEEAKKAHERIEDDIREDKSSGRS